MRRVGSGYVVMNAVSILVILGATFPAESSAHCDTMNGPVVQDARRALESGDIAPVLKWISAADEAVVRDAFKTTSIVRKQSGQAQELADRFFFETVVRIHRAGEGAPYEGLKASESVPPVIAAADQALASGSPEALARDIAASIEKEVRKRFELALERKAHAEESPEAGRRFVSAYVDYIHFVENVHAFAGSDAHGHESHDRPRGHRP